MVEEPHENIGAPATIGQRIRQLRRAKGWSMEHLGQLVGLNKNAVYDLERGRSEYPRSQNLRRYAEVLDTTVEFLQAGVRTSPDELPPLRVYFRSAYPDVPEEDVEVIERIANRSRETQRLRQALRDIEERSDEDQTG